MNRILQASKTYQKIHSTKCSRHTPLRNVSIGGPTGQTRSANLSYSRMAVNHPFSSTRMASYTSLQHLHQLGPLNPQNKSQRLYSSGQLYSRASDSGFRQKISAINLKLTTNASRVNIPTNSHQQKSFLFTRTSRQFSLSTSAQKNRITYLNFPNRSNFLFPNCAASKNTAISLIFAPPERIELRAISSLENPEVLEKRKMIESTREFFGRLESEYVDLDAIQSMKIENLPKLNKRSNPELVSRLMKLMDLMVPSEPALGTYKSFVPEPTTTHYQRYVPKNYSENPLVERALFFNTWRHKCKYNPAVITQFLSNRFHYVEEYVLLLNYMWVFRKVHEVFQFYEQNFLREMKHGNTKIPPLTHTNELRCILIQTAADSGLQIPLARQLYQDGPKPKTVNDSYGMLLLNFKLRNPDEIVQFFSYMKSVGQKMRSVYLNAFITILCRAGKLDNIEDMIVELFKVTTSTHRRYIFNLFFQIQKLHLWAVSIRLLEEATKPENLHIFQPTIPGGRREMKHEILALYTSAVSSCLKGGALAQGEDLIVQLKERFDLEPDLRLWTVMLRAGMMGRVEKVVEIFENNIRPLKPDHTAYCAMIRSTARGDPEIAQKYATEMLNETRFRWDPFTVITLLELYKETQNVSEALKLVDEFRKRSIEPWIRHFKEQNNPRLKTSAAASKMMPKLPFKVRYTNFPPIYKRIIQIFLSQNELKTALQLFAEIKAVPYMRHIQFAPHYTLFFKHLTVNKENDPLVQSLVKEMKKFGLEPTAEDLSYINRTHPSQQSGAPDSQDSNQNEGAEQTYESQAGYDDDLEDENDNFEGEFFEDQRETIEK